MSINLFTRVVSLKQKVRDMPSILIITIIGRKKVKHRKYFYMLKVDDFTTSYKSSELITLTLQPGYDISD